MEFFYTHWCGDSSYKKNGRPDLAYTRALTFGCNSQVFYHLERSKLVELWGKLVQSTLAFLIIFLFWNNHFISPICKWLLASEVKSASSSHLALGYKIVTRKHEQNKMGGEQQSHD
jgi:hypothetical protein